MDQEKFEQHLMGYLFDELDEVTTAAMKRKLDSDAECRELEAGLRATLEVGELPLEEPSDDLGERILAATRLATGREPWHQSLLRSLTWAGSHTMRPQFAMAAVLVLVLGSSLLLMRADPVATAMAPDIEPEPTTPAQAPATDAESPQKEKGSSLGVAKEGADQTERTYKEGLAHYRAGRHEQAQEVLRGVAAGKHHRAPSAALYFARSVRAHSGCRTALPQYEQLRSRHANTSAAEDAAWEQADCHRALGQTPKARRLWASLRNSERYRARAESELAQNEDAGIAGGAVASRRSAPGRKKGVVKTAKKGEAKSKPATAAKAGAAASTATPPAAGPRTKGAPVAAPEKAAPSKPAL